ncbi:S24 family peptidase, partial [Helicobacter sp. MIT 21-1697]|uniref:S24 family peptidase n=1 Tax=Helicobacter sp. MIT 21-1697 TaxID=2993733 RepID=UPI00224B9A91
MELTQSIRYGMDKAGISTYEELSKMSGVPLSTIKKYAATSVQHSPNMSNLVKLGKVIDLSDYFAFDNVSKLSVSDDKGVSKSDSEVGFRSDSAVIPQSKMSHSPSLSQYENVPQSKKQCPSIKKTMSLNQKNNVPQSNSTLPHKPSTIQIPVYDDVYASAGQGLLNEEYITRHIGMQKDFLRDYFGVANFLGLSIITARGDSMSPTIPENCQLLIQQSDSFQEGQICVVRLDNELYVKR